MARKKTQKKHIVKFEVLQNGEYLSDTVKYFHKKSKVILSSTKGDLVLPFYPLSQDIELANISRKGVKLFLDGTWGGFLTASGKPIDIPIGKRGELIYTLHPGDYATITKNDLKVLIKITPEKKKELTKLDKAYRGKMLDLIFDSRLETQIVFVSFLLAAILFGGFVGGLAIRPDDRPIAKAHLEQDYNIAFVNPSHIKHLPEALQDNLDRSKPVISAMRYYSKMTKIFIGEKTSYSRYIFNNTSDLYDQIYELQQAEIDDLLDDQEVMEDQLLEKGGTAMVAIPSIQGESFEGSLVRLMDKLGTIHSTLEEALNSRRIMTQTFADDFSYDFEEYRKHSKKKSANSLISQIRLRKLPTNEEAMYRSAEELSQIAAYEQQAIEARIEPRVPLTPQNTAPIGLSPGSNFVSFVPRLDLPSNEKVAQITASAFGSHLKSSIKEPLIGEINPKLIEKVITKYKFELQLCFELALRRNRNLKGSMEFRWRLDSRGKISDLELMNSTIKDRSMNRCVKQKIARWKFPRPRRGSVEVTYPFVFSPARG